MDRPSVKRTPFESPVALGKQQIEYIRLVLAASDHFAHSVTVQLTTPPEIAGLSAPIPAPERSGVVS